jgi:hypothetical protein
MRYNLFRNALLFNGHVIRVSGLWTTALILCWCLSHPGAAQAQSSGANDLGVVVSDVKFDNLLRTIDLHLANVSPLPVIAYGRALRVQFADGTDWTGETLCDISQWVVIEKILGSLSAATDGLQAFRPGQHYHEHSGFPDISGHGAVVSVGANVTFIVFVDGTAAGGKDEILRQRGSWTTEMVELRSWLPDLQRLRTTSSFEEDCKRSIGRIREVDSPTPSKRPGREDKRLMLRRYLEQALTNTTTIGIDNSKAALEPIIRNFEARITLLEQLTNIQNAK